MNQIENEANALKGKITHLGLLDLRNMRSIDELRNVTSIHLIGTILISDAFKGSLASIPMSHVGTIVSIPEGSKVRQLSGTLKIGGDFLENAGGDSEEILVISGELFITSPFTKVGFKSLIITGQLYVPRGSEGALSSVISQMTGQIIYCKQLNYRVFTGNDRFDMDFFRYMKEPITMILMGDFVMESDVTVEIVQEKVSEIILMGRLVAANKKLVPLLLALTEEKMGEILFEAQ